MASFIVYGDASGQVTVAAPAVAGSNTITFPAETGTLVTSASTISALPGQIAWDTTVKTSGFTAVAYGGYFCNTTGGAFTVTLPATPTRGQFVVIVDYAGTAASNNITVNPNGSKINGGSSKLLQTNRQGITFTYIDSTQGWLATSNVYGGSTPFINAPYTVSYLVQAGGGGGGKGDGGNGGGGAGGLLSGSASLTVGQTYTITVGGGASSGATGGTGSNSVLSGSGITTQTALGGGGGASETAPQAGTSGGCGGGGDRGGAGGSGTPGQGYNGGTGTPASPYGGGGGGGTGAVGGNATPNGGPGGNGTASSITGTPAYYGGGGGGSSRGSSVGPGGLGGGGTGAAGNGTGAAFGTSGDANTGGGAGCNANSQSITTSGGSGVVILSVPTTNYTGTTTGSPTVTTSGSNTILKYTASGTYTA